MSEGYPAPPNFNINPISGRGVAVCSPSDAPFDKTGEWTAKCHAERAIKGRSDRPITDERAIQSLLRTDCPFTMQSEKNPRFTFQEIAFFYGKKNVGGVIEMIRNDTAYYTDLCQIITQNDIPDVLEAGGIQ